MTPLPSNYAAITEKLADLHKTRKQDAGKAAIPIAISVIALLGSVALLAIPGINTITATLSSATALGLGFVGFVVSVYYGSKIKQASGKIATLAISSQLEALQGNLLSAEEKTELKNVLGRLAAQTEWPDYHKKFQVFLVAVTHVRSHSQTEVTQTQIDNIHDTRSELWELLQHATAQDARFMISETIKLTELTYVVNTQVLQEGLYTTTALRSQDHLMTELHPHLWKTHRLQGARSPESLSFTGLPPLTNYPTPGSIIHWSFINAQGETRSMEMVMPDDPKTISGIIQGIANPESPEASQAVVKKALSDQQATFADFIHRAGNPPFTQATQAARAILASHSGERGIREAAALGNIFYDASKSQLSLLPPNPNYPPPTIATVNKALVEQAKAFLQQAVQQIPIGETKTSPPLSDNSEEYQLAISRTEADDTRDTLTVTITLDKPTDGTSYTHTFSYYVSKTGAVEEEDEKTAAMIIDQLVSSPILERELLAAKSEWIEANIEHRILQQLGVPTGLLTPSDLRTIRQALLPLNDEAYQDKLAAAKAAGEANPNDSRAAIMACFRQESP